MRSLGTRVRALWILFWVFSLTGCAYYNTFYFAKKYYNKGERARAAATEDDQGVSSEATRSYDQAILQCKKVLNFHVDSRWADDAVFLMGASYYGKAAYDSALTTFDDHVRAFPDSDDRAAAEYYRGLCFYEQDEFDDMEAAFDTALEVDDEFDRLDDILYTRARTAERQLEYGKAIRSYRQLVARFPGTDRGDDGLLEIGRLYFEAEQYDSAMVAYEELVGSTKDEERYQEAQLQLGRSLIRLGEGEEAFARLARQLPADETILRGRGEYPPQVRLVMAQALNRSGRYEDAIEVLAVVPELYKTTNYAVEAQYQIGFTYESYMDSLGLAEKAYEVAAKMAVRSTFKDLARERLVVLKRLIALSKTTNVEGSADGAVEKKAEAALKIAELYYFSRKEVEEARDQYREVVSEYPETSIAPRAAYGLAWLGLREEPFDSLGAYEAFRDVVEDYPASTQARAALEVLGAADRDTVGLAALLIEPEPEPEEAPQSEPEAVPELPKNSSRFDARRELAADEDSLGNPLWDSLPVDSLSDSPPMDALSPGVSLLRDSLGTETSPLEVISSPLDSTANGLADSLASSPVDVAAPQSEDRKDQP